MKLNNKRNIVGYFTSRFASSFACRFALLVALLFVLLIAGQTSSSNASLLDFFGYNNESGEDYTLENLNEKQQVEYASGDSKGANNPSEQEVEDGEIASIIEQNRKLLMLPETKRQILEPAVLRDNGLGSIKKTSNKSADADIDNIETSSLQKELLQNSNLEIGVKAKQDLGQASTENLKEENFGKVEDILKDAKETQNANISNLNSKKLPPKTFSLKNVNKQKLALEKAKMVKIAEEGNDAGRKLAEEKPLANAKKFSYKTNLEKKKQQAKADLGNSVNQNLTNANQGKELQLNNPLQNVTAKKTATAIDEDPLLTSTDADLARAESKNSLDNSKNNVKFKFSKSGVKKPILAPVETTEKSEKPSLVKVEPENGSNQQEYTQDIVRDMYRQRADSGSQVSLPQEIDKGRKESGLISSLLHDESQQKNKAPLDDANVNKSALTYEQDNSLLNANRQDLQKNAELDYSSLNRKIDQFKPRTPTPNRLFNVDISKPDRFNNTNNLVKKTGSFYRAFGEIVLLQGQVTDSFGVPVVNATIEIWQANSAGKYHNLLEPDSEYIDRYFNMSGRAVTDNLGYYNFITIIPGSIPNRAPHINMNLRHKNFGTLETEVYFFQHPDNKKDSYYLSYSPQERAMLTAMVEYSQLNNPKSLKVATFNIVIRGSHQYKKY